MALLVLSAEEREVDITLGMLAQIVEQRISAHERLVEVQIELAVVEQQS